MGDITGIDGLEEQFTGMLRLRSKIEKIDNGQDKE